MAFNKSLLLVSFLVASMAAPMAVAQTGLIGNLLGLIRIQGKLFCTVNGNIGVNGTATPAFPNALVQLQCGTGNVVASATTNGTGMFSILLDPLQVLLPTLLSNCSLVVKTPLSSCNATLPSGGILKSPLQFVGTTVSGLLKIFNVVPIKWIFKLIY